MHAGTTLARPSFKEQMLAAREEAIVTHVNRLLAEKGFDAMTVDEVAAAVGIAKASLYKHFTSKEELAAAAMVRMLSRAQLFLDTVNIELPPLDKLRAAVRWMLDLQLAGQMPALPSQNSSLRAALVASRDYMDKLVTISDRLGGWIEAAQREGSINPQLPALTVLYTVYARGCDQVLGFLKASGQHTDEQIAELVMATCFDGLRSR